MRMENNIQLSEAQRKAIEAPVDHPSLILAAAGSGKTLVLCHRILYFISQGVAPKDILAVTFSRRAGRDLHHRLQIIAASVSAADASMHVDGLRVRTFHSFCLSVLRAFPNQAGLGPDFIIFTPKMQIHLLEELIKRWYEEKNVQNHPKESKGIAPLEHKRITGFIKEGTFRAEAYRLHKQLRRFQNSRRLIENKSVSSDSDSGVFEWVYDQYCMCLKTVNGIDFSDFPRLAIKVLESCPEALAATGLQAHYVLVDEFQDTDVDQFKLLTLLCRDHKNLTIVGDDDQQIYSWRGAAGFYNLSMFDKVFKGSVITKLEQNFRSTGAIVAAARSVIARNVNRMQKTIRTISPTGTVLSVCECRNEQCEAAAVEDFIISLKEKGIPLQEIAVLYRLQHVGFELQKNLKARGIPCIIKGSGSGAVDGFFGGLASQNVQTMDTVGAVLYDIVAVLRLVICESDDLACKQIMEVICPTLGSSVVSACVQHLQLHQGMPLLQALKCTRSHLLGLKKHESLCFCEEKGQLCQADEKVMEDVHSLLRILETAKGDLKHLQIKDVIMNLLQELPPLRRRKALTKDSNKEHAVGAKDLAMPPSQPELQSHCSIEYTGIKALLKEAAQFDKEREVEDQDIVKTGGKFNSYKDLMQQRRQRQSLLASYRPSVKNLDRAQSQSIKRMRSFLDHVFLKLHDGELGECGESPISHSETKCTSTSDSVDAVSLSTIHQAKGLEWTAVILARANEGVLPLMDSEPLETIIPQAIDGGFVADSQNANLAAKQNYVDHFRVTSRTSDLKAPVDNLNEDASTMDVMVLKAIHTTNEANMGRNLMLQTLEEERRLMYVALTRAKEFLLITHVMLQDGQQMLPSRFLADIPKGLMHQIACYDSTSSQSRIPTSTMSSQSVPFSSIIKSQSIATVQQKKGVALCPTKQQFSQENNFGKCPGKTHTDKRKRVVKSCKINVKRIDLDESLKDIDNLLEVVMEPAVYTQDSMTQSVRAKSNFSKDTGLTDSGIIEGKEKCQFSGHPNAGFVESLSDDSDFESSVSYGKTKNNKFTVSSPNR